VEWRSYRPLEEARREAGKCAPERGEKKQSREGRGRYGVDGSGAWLDEEDVRGGGAGEDVRTDALESVARKDMRTERAFGAIEAVSLHGPTAPRHSTASHPSVIALGRIC
jgi:hypothetical protein